MKKLLLLFSIFIFTIGSSFAAKFQLVVLPVKMDSSYSGLYGAVDLDEIVARDVIKNFNSSYKISATELSSLKSKINDSFELKNSVNSVVNKYIKNAEPDYITLKNIAANFNAKSVLLIYSYVKQDNNPKKRDFYEILKLASVFDIQKRYEIITEAVLFDNVNNLVMWSAMYKTPLNNLDGSIGAKNAGQVSEQINKFKIYSKEILSKNISENVTLRFYPKSVRTISVKTDGDSSDSGAYKFDRDIPSIHKLINRAKYKSTQQFENEGFDEEKYGEMIFEL
ncbi:hypothetical protein IJF81_06305 [bacterium]|nr:hypothetical protein [bacterium]